IIRPEKFPKSESRLFCPAVGQVFSSGRLVRHEGPGASAGWRRLTLSSPAEGLARRLPSSATGGTGLASGAAICWRYFRLTSILRGCPHPTGNFLAVRLLALLSSARMSFCAASVLSFCPIVRYVCPGGLFDAVCSCGWLLFVRLDCLGAQTATTHTNVDTHFRSSMWKNQARQGFFSQRNSINYPRNIPLSSLPLRGIPPSALAAVVVTDFLT
ncbi:MAG: hypothetical protein WA705_27765, partial [Candidatus Ozemobacteraceae bacterium]